jgi:hypothetical protein
VLFEEDRLIREIKRLVEVIARALKLEGIEDREEAESVLGELHRAIFGMDRDLTLKLAPGSLGLLLHPSQKDAAITLLESEIALLTGLDDTAAAAARGAQLEAVRQL